MDDPVRILIVDDDANLRKTLSDILKTKGLEPLPCATGKEALELIGRKKIIVALIDLRLEDISGLEVLRGIKQRSPQTECILLTGHASQATAIEAVNLGAYSYFQKPYDIEQLLLFIRHAVQKVRAEIALAESERRLVTLMSNLPGMAYRCQNDANWTMEFVSEGCYPLTGHQPQDLLANASTGYTNIIHPDDRQMVQDVIKAELERKQPFQLSYRIIAASGEEKWVWEQGQGVYDSDGNLLAFEGFITDITARKQAEEALSAREERFRALIEQSAEVISLLTSEGIILYESPAVSRVLGYQPAEMEGHNAFEFLHPDDFAASQELFKKLFQLPHSPITIEIRYKRKDGTWSWVHATGTNLLAEPSVKALVVNYHDITERKQAEELIRQQSEQLRLLYEASQRLNSTLDLEDIYQAICDFMSVVAPNDALVISDYDPETQLIICRAYWMENKWLDVSPFPPLLLEAEGKGTQSIAIRTGQAMLINDYQAQVKTAQNSYTVDSETNQLQKEIPPDEEITRSALIVPLKSGGKVNGAIQVLSYRLNAYTENQLKLLEALALHIVSAQQNALLYAQVKNELNERKQTEEALRKSEESFRNVFENATVGLYHTTPEGRVILANPALVRMLGYETFEDLAQRNLEEEGFEPDYLRHEFRQRLESEGSINDLEAKWKKKDGTLAIVRESAKVFRNEDGKILYYEGTVEDITARKRAEEDLRRRTLEAETLREASAALTSSLKLDQVLDNLLSQLAQAIPFDSATVFLHKKDYLLAVAAQGLPQPEKVIGQRFPANSTFIQNVDQTHQPLVIADIQKDPRFEKWGGSDYVRGWMSIPLIVHGRVSGNLTMDSRTPNAYSETNAKLALAFANQAAVAIENARLFEEARRRVAELEVLYENSLTITRLLDPHQIAQTITEILSQKLKWHHAAVHLYHPESNSVELLALHQAQTNSAHLTDMMERLQQTVSTGKGLSGWVIEQGEAVCSDDVNADPRYLETYPGIRSGVYVPMKMGETVLGCISAESTQPAAFDEQDQRLLSTMAAQAAIAIHQAQLYEQVQQYAAELEKRVEERTADLQRANLELARASRMKDEFLASMSHELRTPLTGILGLSESLQLKTYGDVSEKQLKILKLIENSGRHLLELINDILDLSKIEAGMFDLQIEPCSLAGMCQAGLQLTKGMAQQKHQNTSFSITPDSIVVRADARRLKQMLVNLLSNAVKFTPEGGSLGIEVKGSQHEQLVRITVWDTGIGIQPEDLPRLFQPFVQLDSSLSRQYAGTGLGLSLVQRMAALHGGSVEVESIPGKGSRFTILLPWETETEQPIAQTDKIASQLHQALTIDENDLTAELLTRYLEKLGLRNQVQLTALGAIELAAQIAPDVILIHLHLPDKPGLELLAEFKSDERTRHIPVILMSVEEKRGEAMALGAAGYLVKPFLLADLQTELERVAALAGNLEPTAKTAPVVLLADDNEIILEVITDFLRTRGFQVVAIHSGSELLERVNETHPDILLIDIQMPGMDGLEVMRRIRAHPDARVSALPMIAVTALAMSGDRERCLAAGANEYLSKPLHLEKLVETIRELCKG